MELLYCIGLFMILAKSGDDDSKYNSYHTCLAKQMKSESCSEYNVADATAAITVPAASSTAACPTLGTVAEGTQTGTVVTVAATGGGALSYALGGTDAAMFAVSAAGVITIAGSAVLDFDTKTSYTVQVTVTDASDSSTIIGTCTVAVTDVAPTFNSYCPEVVIADSVATGATVTAVGCSDGADTAGYTYAKTAGDAATAQFTLATATGVVTKSAATFDAATTSSYSLTFTCTDGTTTTTATVAICLNTKDNCPSSKASINNGVLVGLIVPTLLAIYHLI